jgi:hypothetical protein
LNRDLEPATGDRDPAGTQLAARADMVRVLAVIALAGCTAHTAAERPRAAIQNAAWFAGGAVVGGGGVWVIRDARGDGDHGLGGAFGAALLGTGIVMAFGATLGLLGVAFDDVPD